MALLTEQAGKIYTIVEVCNTSLTHYDKKATLKKWHENGNHFLTNPETMYCSHLEPAEINFLHQIKKELSLDTYQEVVKRVTTVLHAFRQTLSPQSATMLLNSLPDFLKLAFVTNWTRSENYKSVEHLDELVTLVMNRDKKSKQSIFKSEVQTLSVIILTLKKLLKLSGLENFDGISSTLRHELDEVPVEAATV